MEDVLMFLEAAGSPMGCVVLIAWAEWRILPRVRASHALLVAIAAKLGVSGPPPAPNVAEGV